LEYTEKGLIISGYFEQDRQVATYSDLLTYIHTFLLTYLLTYLLIYFLTYLLSYLLHAGESLRSWPVLSWSRNFPHFMEPEGSLPHSL